MTNCYRLILLLFHFFHGIVRVYLNKELFGNKANYDRIFLLHRPNSIEVENKVLFGHQRDNFIVLKLLFRLKLQLF